VVVVIANFRLLGCFRGVCTVMLAAVYMSWANIGIVNKCLDVVQLECFIYVSHDFEIAVSTAMRCLLNSKSDTERFYLD
jgi:hypothetical protein